MEESNRS